METHDVVYNADKYIIYQFKIIPALSNRLGRLAPLKTAAGGEVANFPSKATLP